jgi:hypothetical protein
MFGVQQHLLLEKPVFASTSSSLLDKIVFVTLAKSKHNLL